MIIFEKKNELTNVQMVITNDSLTWMELADDFVNFLQACGYIVKGYDVGNHLCTQYAFQIENEIEEDKRLSKLADERILEHEYKLKSKKKRRKKNAKRKS